MKSEFNDIKFMLNKILTVISKRDTIQNKNVKEKKIDYYYVTKVY